MALSASELQHCVTGKEAQCETRADGGIEPGNRGSVIEPRSPPGEGQAPDQPWILRQYDREISEFRISTSLIYNIYEIRH
jgi:hypothetical protein